MGRKRRTYLEKDFQKQVIELARLLGWRVAWFRPVRIQRMGGGCYFETPVGADGKGWPDLVLVRRERCLFRELKMEDGKGTSPEQDAWLAAFLAAGLDAKVWWCPRDWPEIEESLR